MTYLRISLLGPFQASLDGQPIAGFRANKVRALLAYLAVETGRPHLRPVLAGLLWPDRPDRAALANLRNALATLRHAIGDRAAARVERGEPPFLQITRETIQFNAASGCWLDVAAFRALIEGAETDQMAHQRLEEALALYRGDFLAGFSLPDSPEFEGWSLLMRERLQRQALFALGRLVVHYEAGDDPARACEAAQRLVELAPWEEEAHRRLMRLLALSGRRGAALAQYEACRQSLAQELGVEPEPETAALYERIRDGQVQTARGKPPEAGQGTAGRQARTNNLPAQPAPLIGRQAVLAEIEDRLRDPGCRLLTLVGPGGSGKTRLALEAAARQVERFMDGVFFVALAPLQWVEAIVPTIAQAIGFSFFGTEEPKEQLLRYLSTKNVLLVLDNYEHLLDGAALASEILQRGPEVVVLATSRSGLQVHGEHRFSVSGMSCPPLTVSAADALEYSAVRLFVEGARRGQRGFQLADDNLADVMRICRLVDGLPLSILLAAAWVEMLTPAEIAAEISAEIEGQTTGLGLDLLASNLRDAPERHRSVRAVFDHSWKLLSERERVVMQSLSVFRGGFSPAAAQEVAGASLHDLMALVNWSLLCRAPAPSTGLGTRGRYEMHELLRQYAAAKLALSGAGEAEVRDRHAAYCAAALQGWAEELKGPRQLVAIREVRADVDNLRAAWAWAVEGDRARKPVEWLDRALEGLCLFYEWDSHYEEGEAACRKAVARLAAPAPHLPDGAASADRLRALGHVLAWQGSFSATLGRGDAADRCYERALDALDRAALSGVAADVRRSRARILDRMSRRAWTTAPARARQLAERSLELYRALADRRGMVNALQALALARWTQDALEEATRLYEESLSLSRALGDRRGMIWPLQFLSYSLGELGQIEQAERAAREAVAIAQQVGDRDLVGWANYSLCDALRCSGRFAQARSPLDRVLASLRELGDRQAAAWAWWELGLTSKHLGSYAEAGVAIEAALTLCRESGWRILAANCHVELGRLMLAESAYSAAQEHLQQSIAIYQELGGVRWRASKAHAALAYAARELGQPVQARRHLGSSLGIAADIGAHNSVLHALPAAALLLVDAGARARAVEVYALASRHPFVANSRWFEDVAGREIAAAAAATLSPEVIAAAEDRGRARDLWATVEELLVELGEQP